MGVLAGKVLGALSVALACLLLAIPSPALALKTDTMELVNGDILTGEIKSLLRGKLSYKTDTMETVSIKWALVARLRSTNTFLVTMDDGSQYYGQLLVGDEAHELRVTSLLNPRDLPMDRVVRIERIKGDFLDRVEVSLAFGFNYTKASQLSQLTLDGRTAYKDRADFAELTFSSILTDQKAGGGVTRQGEVIGKYQRTLTGKLFGNLTSGAQSNDELDLDLRIFGTLGAGLYLVENGWSRLTGSVGLSSNRERYLAEEDSENNLEAVYSGGYSLFFYETPKTDLQLSAVLYDGLNATRTRIELDASVNRELVKDFFIALTYYDNYDSRPPESAQSSRDNGVVLKISWNKY